MNSRKYNISLITLMILVIANVVLIFIGMSTTKDGYVYLLCSGISMFYCLLCLVMLHIGR